MRAWPFRLICSLFSSRPRGDRESKLSRLEQRLGYFFKDSNLLQTALSHLSYINETGRKDTESNERLEFLGDAVLDLIVSEYLYTRFHTAREGDLTRIKSSIVSRSALARRASQLKLADYILFAKESFPDLKRGEKTIISNSLEAIIGAIYLDGGLDAARSFVYNKLLDRGKISLSIDRLQQAKNGLLHLAQVNYGCQPSYRIIKVTGPEHARRFVCEVSLKDEILGRGVGVNKKEAEKQAAFQALEKLVERRPRKRKSGSEESESESK